jgi:hypothetical protein
MHRSDDCQFSSWPTAQAWTNYLGMRTKIKHNLFIVINKENRIVIAIRDRLPRKSIQCSERKAMMTSSSRLKTLSKTHFFFLHNRSTVMESQVQY